MASYQSIVRGFEVMEDDRRNRAAQTQKPSQTEPRTTTKKIAKKPERKRHTRSPLVATATANSSCTSEPAFAMAAAPSQET